MGKGGVLWAPRSQAEGTERKRRMRAVRSGGWTEEREKGRGAAMGGRSFKLLELGLSSNSRTGRRKKGCGVPI